MIDMYLADKSIIMIIVSSCVQFDLLDAGMKQVKCGIYSFNLKGKALVYIPIPLGPPRNMRWTFCFLERGTGT